jgi:hypothetical protein
MSATEKNEIAATIKNIIKMLIILVLPMFMGSP